jgi:hypothetical protein
MKVKSRILTLSAFLAICAAVAMIGPAPKVHGQDSSTAKLKGYFAVHPLQNPDYDAIQAASDAGTGLKVFTYHVTSTRQGSKGQKFTGVMVGNSPFTSKTTTTTTLQIVPVIVDISGTIFDPTKPDNNCAAGKVPLKLLQQSPMVLPAQFTLNGVNVGKEQYSDAFQRANFWKPIVKNGGTYHNKLKVVTLKPIHYSQGSKGMILGTSCGPLGGLDFQTLLNDFESTVVPALQNSGQGVGPTTFPAFQFYNVVMYEGTVNQCCVLGFHDAFNSPKGVQTYSPFDFDLTGDFGPGISDTYIAAHEIDEWQDDPLGNNATPPWGNIGQVQGCQNNLEVGDPLTGTPPITVKMSNGFTYNLQELAFFNWFFGPPSIGAGGKFSDNGTFTSAQGACTN